MLEPRDRRLLLDALRPPEGYDLDHALGTTYSLDLLALLTAPLAFTLFDAEPSGDADADGSSRDPLALLTALRRYAERVTLFCQAGQIAVPARHQLLFGYLEGSVFQARCPDPRFAFHPKVWLLRFVTEGGPVRYRLLCASRNLTFDRSWDTLLALDGELRDRTTAIARNRPLGDFVAALPGLVDPPLPPAVRRVVDRLQGEVLRVQFEPPDGLELKAFWPLGIPGARWPFRERMDRLLVVSPFVSAGLLARLAEGREASLLVSRQESLTPLSAEDLADYERVYSLDPAAEPDQAQEDPQAPEVLAGLHAKFYLADAGWEARLWTGSANATEAAFGGNVEFLVELEGKRSSFGIDALLRPGGAGESFAGLLREFRARGEPDEGDPEQRRLEEEVEGVRRLVAGAGLRASLSPADAPDTFRLLLLLPEGARLQVSEGVRVHTWPVNLPEAQARPLDPTGPVAAAFERLTEPAVTGFFAFAVVARRGPCDAGARFVLNLPVEGAPADRRERLLRALLRDRAQVLRLLRLLLAESGAEAIGLLRAAVGGGGPGQGEAAGSAPLLETLVRALDRNPARLDEVARLVEDLSHTPEGRELLPAEFDAVWAPVWAARQRRRR